MTEASIRAMDHLRDFSTLEWYVIPLLAITGRSAFWTAPGDTALRTMAGWNIEIMFAIAGIVF